MVCNALLLGCCELIPCGRTAVPVVLRTKKYLELHDTGTVKKWLCGAVVVPWYQQSCLVASSVVGTVTGYVPISTPYFCAVVIIWIYFVIDVIQKKTDYWWHSSTGLPRLSWKETDKWIWLSSTYSQDGSNHAVQIRVSIVALTSDRFSDLFSRHYCEISRDLT